MAQLKTLKSQRIIQLRGVYYLIKRYTDGTKHVTKFGARKAKAQ